MENNAGPIQNQMESKIKAYFGEHLGFLELINESHKHASHTAMRENPDL